MPLLLALADTSIPYRIDYGGWSIIPILVNGEGPYDFIIDTAAVGTVINGPALGSIPQNIRVNVRPLGLEARQRPIDLLNVTKFAKVIKVKRFSIGRTRWYRKNSTAYDAPIFDDLGMRGKPFGLFGSNFLRDRSFAINFTKDEIFIGPK